MRNPMSLFTLARSLLLGTLLVLGAPAFAQTDPLPSWNDGPAKQAIVTFVKDTTTQGSPNFVPPAERIATFDQDGTLWVEHPMYSQVMYILESVPALVKAKPELAKVAPDSVSAPSVPEEVKFVGDPKEIIDSVYDFAGKVLELNKQFVRDLLDVTKSDK